MLDKLPENCTNISGPQGIERSDFGDALTLTLEIDIWFLVKYVGNHCTKLNFYTDIKSAQRINPNDYLVSCQKGNIYRYNSILESLSKTFQSTKRKTSSKVL